MMQANATFEIKSWDEKPYDEFDGRKLTRARVGRIFHGDIEGESSTEYLMAYAPDGSANFVAIQRIIGRLGSRSGSFVLQHTGAFQGGIATEICTILPGSATGELAGIKGVAKFSSGHAQEYSLTVDYEFESAQTEMRDDM
jgi:hypothetical protein